MKFKILFIVGILLGTVLLADAGERSKKKNKQEAKVEKKKDNRYDELFQGKKCETVQGMITLHKMDGKLYFEFPVRLLEKDMLLGSTITTITDNRFGCVGEKPHDPIHVLFTRNDASVQLREVSTKYLTKDRNIAERLAESTRPAIVANFEIEAYNADSTAVVFDVTDYFVGDNDKLNPFSPYSAMLSEDMTLQKEFKKDNSHVAKIKAFSDNVGIQSSLTYSVSVRDRKYYYVYKMPFTAVLTRSLILLPEEPMRPRIADPRINIFTQGMSEFCNDGRSVKEVHFANRWRLEPSDPEAYKRGELVEPKQPIVYYIDNNFPESWKQPVRDAVERWQATFEKIGFKNAIIAKDFPTDDPEFDPDNIKYSCVRYAPSWIANAMGPSWTDPRTGEIINASVYLYHNLIELVQNWRFLQTAPADPDARKVVLDDDIIADCIRYVVAHEVGHTLALMHNMAGSSSIPVDSLRSPSFTQKYGTTYSIMDYARNNYVAQPGDKERGVRLTPPELGLADYFSIKWLYTPLLDAKTPEEEVPTLDRWISEKSGDPIYRYGKQQFSYRIDPSSCEEDLGDDAMKASDYGIRNLKYLLNHLNEWVADEDKDFTFRETMYNEVIYQYLRYMNNVLINIGGIYLNERYEGDQLPGYAPVPREKQERALAFMMKELKDMEWLNSPELQKNLPLRGNIVSILEDMIFESVFKRIPHVARCADKMKENPYTQENYLNDMYDFIWAPTQQGKNLSRVDKKLQLSYLSFIMSLSGAAEKGMGGSPVGLASSMIAIPDFVKEKSREDYGILPESLVGIYTNKEVSTYEVRERMYREVERQAFGFSVSAVPPSEPMEHVYFDALKKVKTLLNSKVNTGSEDTRKHYRLMIYKINQALK